MDKEIVISIKTILFTFLLGICLYVLLRLASIIGLFCIALVIVFAMEPLIKRFMQGTLLNKKINRSVAVIFAYVLLVATLVLIITIWLPPFLTEAQKMIKNIPKIISQIDLGENVNLTEVIPQASKISGGLLSGLVSVFSNITGIFSVFIMALYMSLDWPNLKKRFASLFPSKAEDVVYDSLDEVELSLGHWVKGEAMLMLIVGLLSFVGLLMLDVDFPLALGLIAGLMEVVPMVGPLVSGAIAAVIAFSDSPVKALGVVVLFIIIQQLENNLLVPKVMQKVSGFSPLIILFALLVGGEFFGIAGAVLAVPAAMTLGIVFKRVFRFIR